MSEINLEELINLINQQKEIDVKKALIYQTETIIKQNKLPFKVDVKGGVICLIDMRQSTDAFLSKFITVDSKMIQLKEDVRVLAPTEHEVLITGPTGTGKEIIARALHGEREGKFIAVNCAGLPETLIESLMFGHIAGSFTNAVKTTEGLMSVAKDGTFFLDE